MQFSVWKAQRSRSSGLGSLVIRIWGWRFSSPGLGFRVQGFALTVRMGLHMNYHQCERYQRISMGGHRGFFGSSVWSLTCSLIGNPNIDCCSLKGSMSPHGIYLGPKVIIWEPR